MKAKNLIGQRFGKLFVIERVYNTNKQGTRWVCKCDCGKEKIISTNCLLHENTKSCGCYSFKWQKNVIRHPTKEHKELYTVYRNIIRRCYNETYKQYKDYGGRGIIMCSEWKDNFENFYSWAMLNGYKKGLSIDRINNNGIYEPSNCRWSTREQQANNKRTSVYIEYKNEKHTIREWSKITGINYQSLCNRIKKNMPLTQCFYKGNLKDKGVLDDDII